MEQELLSKVNEYMFNKRESIVVQPSRPDFKSSYEQIKVVSALVSNLNDLGYDIDQNDIPYLLRMSEKNLMENVYNPLLKAAKESKGAHVEHKILFTGFPESAKKLDINTLSDIRFMSYFTTCFDILTQHNAMDNGSITRDFVDRALAYCIEEKEKEDAKIKEVINKKDSPSDMLKKIQKYMAEKEQNNDKKSPENAMRKIHLVRESEYYGLLNNMLSAKAALSDYDKEIVMHALNNFDQKEFMPQRIQFRETAALIDKFNFENKKYDSINIRSMGDFQRFLASLSEMDPELREKPIIKNFTNQERKELATIFNNALENHRGTMIETSLDPKSKRFMQNVLTKRLHFNQLGYKNQYNQFVKDVERTRSVMSRYESHMEERDFVKAAKVLQSKSSTLLIQHAKKLFSEANEKWQSMSTEKMNVEKRQLMQVLKSAANKTDITILMALQHALDNNEPFRIIVSGGDTAELLVKENKITELPKDLIVEMKNAVQEGIDNQTRNVTMDGKIKMSPGTKVYIDPNLKDCPIPKTNREDNSKNRNVPIGTKIPVRETEILRAALYKKNERNQFIDFSVGVLDKNYKFLQQVSWNNLKSSCGNKLLGYHSGDVLNCRNGCTEIIDLNLDMVREAIPQASYLVYGAFMWEGQPISSCEEIFMTLSTAKETGKLNGEKIPKNPDIKKVLDPRDVMLKVDVAGNNRATIPVMYDIEKHKVVVLNAAEKTMSMNDLGYCQRHFDLPSGCECLENYAGGIALKAYAVDNLNVPNIYELAMSFARTHDVELVQDPNKADAVFSATPDEIVDKRIKPIKTMIDKQTGKETKIEIELPAQVVISEFDKDIITAELIPDTTKIEKETEIESQIKNEEELDTEEDLEIE